MLGAISSAAKHTFNMRTTATSPSVSPRKKKGQMESQSAIHATITLAKDKPQGLMMFFKQNMHEEYNEQVQKHTAEEDEFAQKHQEMSDKVNRCRTEMAKEDA
jgi:hypothetical protein